MLQADEPFLGKLHMVVGTVVEAKRRQSILRTALVSCYALEYALHHRSNCAVWVKDKSTPLID